MTFEVDFENPRDGWRGRKVGKVSFVPERIDASLRNKQTSYGDRSYFLVWLADSEHVMSFPARYWPPNFNVGDRVTIEVEIEKYNPDQAFVNVCNFKDAIEPIIISGTSGSTPSGNLEDVIISTKYIANEKQSESMHTGEVVRYFNAIRADVDGASGVTKVRFDSGSMVLMPGDFDWVRYNMEPDQSMVLAKDDLQYAHMETSGIKSGPDYLVTSIQQFTKVKYPNEIRMPVSELTFFGGRANDIDSNWITPGATFRYEQEDNDGNIEIHSGFIPESEFPFECSPMVNRIKEMYPEEFAHPVTIVGYFERYDRIKKVDDNWMTTSFYSAATPVRTKGLDVPTIADNLVRVTDSFFANEKYNKAARALAQMSGCVTYKKAATVFIGLGLTFTEDEYYREIESRLVAEHKEYDREYFDIVKERADESNGEWGGNPATGEFVFIFPEEKLIVIEMPVPNKATYFYRIHDGMTDEEALSRINLASPANGVRRSALLSGLSFKDELYDRWASSRDTTWLSARMTYINNLVAEGIIDNTGDNLKAWTGFIGRAMHRSYENYTMKLDQALESAKDMILTSSGYEEVKKNSLLLSAAISGGVAALAGFIIGDRVESQRMSGQLDESLSSLNNSTAMNMNELFKQDWKLVGIGATSDTNAEKEKATAAGHTDLIALTDKDLVFVLGKRRRRTRNNPVSTIDAEKAFETFHDQPHKNTVAARPHMKKKDTTVLGPLKHIIYFCSKWSEDGKGNVVDDNNVDVHYIHEWNEDGSGLDAGDNCMWVAASNDRQNILLLGNCEVLDVGITDAQSPNDSPEKLLADFKMPKDMSWLGECKEIAYIDGDGKKQILKFKRAELATGAGMEKLYIVEQ